MLIWGKLRKLAKLLVCLAAVLACACVSLAQTGAQIPNQATVAFSSGQGSSSALSNLVIVQKQIDLLQLTNNQTIYARPGAAVVFLHKLTNLGSATTQLTASLQFLNSNQFDISSAKLYLDVNNNGVLDPSDTPITNTTQLTLAAGESCGILVALTMPAVSTVGNQSSLILTFTSSSQNASTSNTDTVVVSGTNVQLQKTASVTSAKPSDNIRFILTATNGGDLFAGGIAVTVDGASKSLLVVRDVIPANTVFQQVVNNGGAQVLFHIAGDPAVNNYVSVAPSDLSTVDAIAFASPNLAGGASLASSFSVVVKSNASGTISNVGTVAYDDNGAQQKQSNVVSIQVPAQAPQISFYDSGYSKAATVSNIGSPLYVQASAAACNLNPLLAETQRIHISASLSHDQETFNAVETGPNTGVFRIVPSVATSNALSNAVVPGDGVLEVLPNDQLVATVSCGGNTATSLLYVDPSGMVFDSKTNAPVAGAIVTLIDVDGSGNGGQAGKPAAVLGPDGVTTAPGTVTTGADGRFQFALVSPSRYRLQVTPPNGYKTPSTLGPQQLPSGHSIDPAGSYLQTFTVSAASPVLLDVPADASSISGLFVEKTASVQTVQIGDFVDFAVKVKNDSGVVLTNVIVDDLFPAGMRYIAGTSSKNGVRVADPSQSGSDALFSIGDLAVGGTATITYRVAIGPGSHSGKMTNIATAKSGRATSNQAQAVILIQQGGVFSSQGFVVGHVSASCFAADGKAQHLGVPGIRVFLEDGTYSITDALGRYSFYGVSPTTHVVKVDAYTVPRGTHLVAGTSRSARDGNSLFVDLKNGELRRADFEMTCSDKVRSLIEERIKSSQKTESEPSRLVKSSFTTDAPATAQSSSMRTLPSSGVVGQPGAAGSDPSHVIVDGGGGAASALEPAPHATIPGQSSTSHAKPEISVEQLLEGADAKIGFLNLNSDQILATPQTAIWVKGPEGSEFKLRVNKVLIPESRIGNKLGVASKQLTAWEYIGVDLKTGSNEITASVTDPFGNERTSTIHVVVPDQIAKIKVVVPTAAIQADGYSLAHVKITLLDNNDVVVRGTSQVTLQASAGTWKAKDYDEEEPGVQTFIENGEADIPLIAPMDPATVKIRVSANGVVADDKISFVPPLRPLTADGIMDYQLNFRQLPKNAIQPVNGTEGFEDEIRLFSASNNSVQGGSRTALYLKGRILGNNLLTFAYDSNKTSQTLMFRDIQPDQFYPVYGDSSTRGYDAQSVGKMYLRVDNGKSYLVYGDFLTTAEGDAARTLTNYSRSLTGVKQHYENGSSAVTTFASYDTFQQVVQEFPANGTSGPFTFQYTNGVANSETVSLIIRDRNQPAVVLQTIPQVRFVDYEFEPFTGRLLFKGPVPTLDQNMNPIYIHVIYEVDQGGERFWSGGFDGQTKLNKNVQLGMMAAADGNPQNPFQLYGLNSKINLPFKSVLTAELANSHEQLEGAGVGYRVEYKQDSKNLKSDIYVARTSAHFENPSSTFLEGRGEAGGKMTYKLAANTQFTGQFIRSEDVKTGGTQVGADVGVEQSLPHGLKFKLDLRHAQQSLAVTPVIGTPATTTSDAAPTSLTTLGASLTGKINQWRHIELSAGYEQDLADSSKRRLELSVSEPIGKHGKIYVRHEFLSSLGDVYSLNSMQSRMATVIGIDTDYLKHAHAFTEYRQHDELTNRESEAALGLRNMWQLNKHVALTGSFENIRTLSGTSNNSTAVTGGVEFSTDNNLRGSARVELRDGTTSNSYLTNFSIGKQVSSSWTLLSRNVLLYNVAKAIAATSTTPAVPELPGNVTRQARVQFGAAYRGSQESRWDVLTMLEYRNENGNNIGNTLVTDTPVVVTAVPHRELALFSTNLNYQPAAGFSFSARYANKYLLDGTNGLDTNGFYQALSFHVTKDIARKWDVGLLGSVMTNSNLSWRQNGIGTEIGYCLKQNLWVSSGYNFMGYNETDLPGSSDSRRGAFVRLRFKFDENILKGRNRTKLSDTARE